MDPQTPNTSTPTGRQAQAKPLPKPPTKLTDDKTPFTKANEKNARAYILALNDYMKSLRYADMNFFKFRWQAAKTEFKTTILEGLIDIAKATGVNFLHGRDDQFREEAKALQELVKLTKDNTKVQAEAAADAADRAEEDRREGNTPGSMYHAMLKFFKENSERGEKVKNKLGMGNFSLFDLLDPNSARGVALGWVDKITLPLTTALATIAIQALGLLATGATPIAGGVAIGVFDALNAGLKSIDWGINKMPAMIAGFLAGSDRIVLGNLLTSVGTYKNVAKWALIGAGIGSFFPVVGTLVGGLIGAVVGLILTAIGPEKIGKFIQRFTDNIKKLTDAVFGTDYFTVDDMKDRIASLQKSTEEHKKEIAQNLERIGVLRNELRAAEASGDTVKAEALRKEIANLEAINADIQSDIDQNDRYMKDYQEDLKQESLPRWQRILMAYKDYIMLFVPDWMEEWLATKSGEMKEWWKGAKERMWKAIIDAKDSIVDSFWKLIDKIKGVFVNMADNIWSGIKDMAWQKMQGNLVTEKLYESMFGKADVKVSPAAREPEEYSMINDYYGKAERAGKGLYDAMVTAKDAIGSAYEYSGIGNLIERDTSRLSRIEDKADREKVGTPVQAIVHAPSSVSQDNRTNINNTVKHYSIPNPYGAGTLYRRNMTGGGAGW